LRLVEVGRADERCVVAERCGAIRVFDSFGGGFSAGAGDQNFARRGGFLCGLPQAINFFPAQED